MNALLLAGHGSHISPNTAGLVWSWVDRLRQAGAADEVGACFWKERPALSQALDTLCAETVVVVPVLAAGGWFARRVIPAEMGLDGPLTLRDGRRIHYTQPLGLHPGLGDIVLRRIREHIERHNLDARDLAVAIIGHGTRRDARSRDAARERARELAARLPQLQVLEAYLDDDPAIPTIYERTDAPVILALPWFLAPGSHVSHDVPGELGLPEGASCGRCEGRQVYYLDAPGTVDEACELILDLARKCVPDMKAREPASVWGCFPRRGARSLWRTVCERGQMALGELQLSPTRVRPLGGDPGEEVADSPERLRSLVREDPFRPLPEARGLPGGWRAAIDGPDQLAAVVETVYPGAMADRDAMQRGGFRARSLADVARRQIGNFRGVDRLSTETVRRITSRLCGDCVRQPCWAGARAEGDELPCAEPCNVWLSQAIMEPA